MQTADIIPRAAGDFVLQCRTAEHVDAGMIAKFHIEDSGDSHYHCQDVCALALGAAHTPS